MKTILSAALAVSFMLLLAPAAFSQRSGVDVFLGYSNLQAEGLPNPTPSNTPFGIDFFRDRSTLHGFNAEVTGYPTDAFGLTGDFSFNRKERRSEVTGGEDVIRTDVYYFMAGPQLSVRNSGRLEPFVRVLAGGAHTRFEASSRRVVLNGDVTSSFDTGSTSFAMAAGGGLDIRLGDNFKLRVIQVDYAPVFLRDRSVEVLGATGVIQPQTLEGQRQDNVRFSFGIVF